MRQHPAWFSSIFPNRAKQGRCTHCELCVAGRNCRPYETEQEGGRRRKVRSRLDIAIATSLQRDCNHGRHVEQTALVHSRKSRISFFRYIIPRWQGSLCPHFIMHRPLIVTLLVNTTQLTQVKTELEAANLPPSYEVILMIVSPKSPLFSHFPINRLRNIAIRHVITSHFLVLDMDLWPSCTSSFHVSHSKHLRYTFESPAVHSG